MSSSTKSLGSILVRTSHLYRLQEAMRRIESFHRGKVRLANEEIDDLLGIAEPAEEAIDYRSLSARYGKQQWLYEGTPYTYIRYLTHVLELSEADVVYDLGCGYGRLVLYGALVTPAEYRGVEIVPERLLVAELARIRFGLGNARFFRGDVLDQDYSEGTIFFMFNPFADHVLKQVADELRLVGITRPIKIVTWGGPLNHLFASQPWLKELPLSSDPSVDRVYGLRLFTS